jgi:hypothetical protein
MEDLLTVRREVESPSRSSKSKAKRGPSLTSTTEPLPPGEDSNGGIYHRVNNFLVTPSGLRANNFPLYERGRNGCLYFFYRQTDCTYVLVPFSIVFYRQTDCVICAFRC